MINLNDKILKQLEFNKIIDSLLEQTATSLGKERVKKLKPSTNLDEVVEWQNETDEAVTILRLKGHVPFGGITDIRPYIKRAKIGGILSATECLDVATTLYGGRQFKKFILSLEEVSLPIFFQIAEQIHSLKPLEQSIKRCIDDHGQVLDSASDKLRTIRSQIRSYENSVRDKLENYTRTKSQMLSDAIVTIRNGRYVLPVKHEYRASFGGIVHDQSSSGQTLFIEPQSVVELNNKLQEAKMEEQIEIERILRDLSLLIQEEAPLLEENIENLQRADFLIAKGKLAHKMKAAKPKMNQNGYIHLKSARHPLIDSSEVVSNDIEIGKDFTAIVITGPNTGGKTVTLKMVGLCTLMAQSGLQVPALDGCELAVFDHVFADIGDEQSIEQNLSTFSSHMTNIVTILNEVNSNTLVLFDELGAGTDPQEGAGLAMAILDYVVEKKARVIATTHYPELKAYSYNRPGVTNASMEFDVDTLQPTYRLLLGVPGRSNAFEISKRLGLSDEIINRAQSMINEESRSVENMIASLEETRKKSEREYEEAEQFLHEAEDLLLQLKREYQSYLNEKERLTEEAKAKAREIIEKAEHEANEIIDEIKEMKNEAMIKEHRLIEVKKRFDEHKESFSENKQTSQKTAPSNQKFLPGDEVHVLSFNQNGHIISEISEKEYEVQLGILKMKVSSDQLQLIKRPEPLKTKPLTTIKGSSYHVKPELDLRGERYEDALNRLDKYIDEALLAGYNQVSIIHGKGTGALMKGVHEFAKNHPMIKSYKFANVNAGGTGATILELK